MDLSLVLENEN